MFFIIFFLLFFFSNFFKNPNNLFIDQFKYNNSIWDYVLILNNNNKSLILFVCLFVWLVILKKGFIEKEYFVLLFLIVFYSIDSNLFFNFYLNSFNKVNVKLINGVVLVHPFLMYLSYCFFLILVLTAQYKTKKINNTIHRLKVLKKNILVFSWLALMLGSYWSQQEMNWGGWWNWDFVEIIALVFFILSILVNHLNNIKNLNFLNNIKIKIINYLILFYFLIRLDFINSIHSFSSFNKTNFNLNILLLIYIIFFIIVVFNNNYKKYYINWYNSIKNNNIVVLLFLILLFTFNLYIYINILISYFYNNQFIELTKNLKKFLNCIIFLFSLFFIAKNKIILLVFLLISKNNLFIYLFLVLITIIKVINNYKYNYKNVFHIFIVIFIIINNFYYSYQFFLNLNWIQLSLNLNLTNNLNIFNNFWNDIKSFNRCNINNYNYQINSYYYVNNNILFNNIFLEILLNNILLVGKKTAITYSIGETFMSFQFHKLCLSYTFLLLNFIYFFKSFSNLSLKKFKIAEIILVV